VEFVRGQLDSLFRRWVREWDYHRYPDPRSFPLLHFLRYTACLRLVILIDPNVMVETGSQAWLYGGLLNITSSNGEIVSYPTADYRIDGASGKSFSGNADHLRHSPGSALQPVPKSHGLTVDRSSTSRHQSSRKAVTRLTSQ